MKRGWALAWIWSTIVVGVGVAGVGTVGVILNSAVLGNLCTLWGTILLYSLCGLAGTFILFKVSIEPKRPRLSRAARKELHRQREHAELQRRIADLEKETGTGMSS